MFDGLKALLQRGDAAIQVAPPKPVAAAPAPSPDGMYAAPEIASAEQLHADPYGDLKKYGSVGGGNTSTVDSLVTAAPAEVSSVLAAVSSPHEELDAALTNAIAATPLTDELTGEIWNRPVDPVEEANENLEPRSNKRIAHLLQTWEAQDPMGQRTQARILNDKMRHRNLHPVPTYSPYKKPTTNPQAAIVKA